MTNDVIAYDWGKLPSRWELLDRVDRMDLSADAKLLLANLAKATVEIGGRVLEVGRRILAFAFEMAKTFPNTLFGVIVAVVVTMLIASIPFLGAILGPLVAPLFLAFGLASGAMQDVKEGALRRRSSSLRSNSELWRRDRPHRRPFRNRASGRRPAALQTAAAHR